MLVKDGVSESGTICDREGEEEEGGQNTILRSDANDSPRHALSN